jgi:hypothetical protein
LAEQFPFLENRRMAERFQRENQSHEQNQGAESGHNPVSSAERSGRSSLNPHSGFEDDDDVASANNPFLKPAAAGTKRTYERDISPTPSQDEQFRRLEISKSLARQKAEGSSSKKRRIRDDSSRESTLEPIDEASEQEEREVGSSARKITERMEKLSTQPTSIEREKEWRDNWVLLGNDPLIRKRFEEVFKVKTPAGETEKNIAQDSAQTSTKNPFSSIPKPLTAKQRAEYEKYRIERQGKPQQREDFSMPSTSRAAYETSTPFSSYETPRMTKTAQARKVSFNDTPSTIATEQRQEGDKESLEYIVSKLLTSTRLQLNDILAKSYKDGLQIVMDVQENLRSIEKIVKWADPSLIDIMIDTLERAYQHIVDDRSQVLDCALLVYHQNLIKTLIHTVNAMKARRQPSSEATLRHDQYEKSDYDQSRRSANPQSMQRSSIRYDEDGERVTYSDDGSPVRRINNLFEEGKVVQHDKDGHRTYVTLTLPAGYFGPKVASNSNAANKYLKVKDVTKYLSVFKGENDDFGYNAWWTAFREGIHLLPRDIISRDQQFRELQKLISPEVSQVIGQFQNLLCIGDAYPYHLKNMAQIYGGRGESTENVVTQMVKTAPADFSNKSLKKFICNMETFWRKLNTLEGKNGGWAEQVHDHLMAKLPTELKQDYRNFTAHKSSSSLKRDYYQITKTGIDYLIIELSQPGAPENYVKQENMVEMMSKLERLCANKQQQQDQYQSKGGKGGNPRNPPRNPPAGSAGDVPSFLTQPTDKPKQTCPFHDKATTHDPSVCSLSQEKKYQHCSANKICLKCLSSDHTTSRCPKTDLLCAYCKSPWHQILLCRKKAQDQEADSGGPTVPSLKTDPKDSSTKDKLPNSYPGKPPGSDKRGSGKRGGRGRGRGRGGSGGDRGEKSEDKQKSNQEQDSQDKTDQSEKSEDKKTDNTKKENVEVREDDLSELYKQLSS